VSRLGFICLLLTGLCFVIVLVARFILGGWFDVLWAPLAVGLAGLGGLLFLEVRTILEFLTMRTTKNGMNMGAVILMALVIIGSVNYISVRYDQNIDLTDEKINSLSDQSQTVLDNLDSELSIMVFYKGEPAAQERDQMKTNLELYGKHKSSVRSRFFNTYTENLKAQEYLNPLPDKDSNKIFAFVEYKNKKVRVENPVYSEEKITSAIVKATRTETKTIYFLSSHGEKDLESQELEGLSGLKQALADSSFVVKPLDLVGQAGVPEDATLVAVIGPRTPLLPKEIDLLLSYVERGGRLFLAADPGERHNLPLLTKPIGVEYKNNYVLSPISQLLGKSAASAMGVEYSQMSPITKKFNTNMTVFDLVSEVVAAPETSFEVTELVKSHAQSFAADDLSNIDQSEQRAFSMGVSVKGKYKRVASQEKGDGKSGDAGGIEFTAVVFGDTDFLTNQGMILGLNRDLALNSFSFLADEEDTISIRPKQLKGTKIELPYTAQKTIIIGGIALPLSMFILSGVLWFRRRGS